MNTKYRKHFYKSTGTWGIKLSKRQQKELAKRNLELIYEQKIQKSS